MSATLDRVSSSRRTRILMIAANPAVSTTLGWPVGFWASELVHPWYEFTEAGYEVTIASPKGGALQLDALSDPRDASGYSAHDVLSMGFLHTPVLAKLLEETPAITSLRADDFDAVVVCGGQSPMFTFPQEEALHALLQRFYEGEKVTAALCHGVAAFLHVTLADGTPLLRGRTVTGFANSEEDIADQIVGQKVMPFRIEDEARAQGANFVSRGPWKPFAVRDGRLITGQQQYSGREVARLVIEALGR